VIFSISDVLGDIIGAQLVGIELDIIAGKVLVETSRLVRAA